ncbi:MAG TPA: carboxypeptidase regulatory-like domain-containing protein, partial [Gemmatimonadales bacterium]|nr:carboxypeptidase regulatory-like domain-containing protein [Gemmatimonadales bacterium]
MRTRSLARPGLGLLTALLALCPPLDAQRLGSINGTVLTSTNRSGIEGARVVLIGTPFVMSTNARGEFTFNGLVPGKYI